MNVVRIVAVVLAALVVLLAVLIWYEARSSRIQARLASRYASRLTFSMQPGPTDSVVYPVAGPFDLRRGYVRLPGFTDTLMTQGYEITAQARFSPEMMKLANRGLYPPYKEKSQAGLVVLDAQDRLLYSATYPERVYASFDSIPDLVVQTLLFIENRELLKPGSSTRNPAVEWDRLARATFDLVVHKVFRTREMPGGSTLATQIEKYRHTEEGRTTDPTDKLKQMASATLRAYLDGENTEPVRKEIILNFVNSVPLAAIAGYGEVNGLGDGLWAWYDVDFNETNRLLKSIEGQPGLTARRTAADADRSDAPVELTSRLEARAARADIQLEDQATAFKQMLSLFIAHRRPTTYLHGNREMLRTDTDAYLRLLAAGGLISPEFRDVSLPIPLEFRKTSPHTAHDSFVERKAANAIRTRLLSLMDLEQLYDLDRVDLTARSTLDRDTQKSVTELLQNLKSRKFAQESGLVGFRLLEKGDPSGVIYSFTLYESTPSGNKLRVQADNYDQPLDINEGAKLDLGSTAKLRTLVNYLTIVADLHRQHAGKPRRELNGVRVDRNDHIRRWTLDYLASASDTSLRATLEAAMDRHYSASPGEQFFTSGGLLSFVNFDPTHNGMNMSVREATRHSVNLVYIRLMRDIERFYMADLPGFSSDLFDDPKHPARQKYLSRFADKEGKDYLAKFWPRYRGKTPDEALDTIVSGIRPTATRLAVIFRSVRPLAPLDEFRSFVARHMKGAMPTESVIQSAYTTYAREAFNLQDRGYVARIHPLELWIVEYIQRNPEASWNDLVTASADARQEVYQWLFTTRFRESQNSRIRTLLEIEAFQKIHEAWQRQGYPFSSLVPSYATSIGSSADRPAALAELMGIIVNDGMRLPSSRIESLHFARGTPYETLFEKKTLPGERIFPSEVAQVARNAVVDVVENGTARRGFHIFERADGTFVPVGGKTGTGDHRFETYGKGGALIESRVVNRTATFVFLIGDRYFGTVTAYVAGEKAAGYGFTSSLPVQILKILAPALEPLVASETETAEQIRN